MFFRPYEGNDISLFYTHLPRWGWCKATKHHNPEIVSLIGKWTVSRLGWGQDNLSWEELNSEERAILIRHYESISNS